MSITPGQVRIAQSRQYAAAHDMNSQVRLIAGPGTGKSYAIQERVNWLLGRDIAPDSIFVVSFTRASTLDLHNRILQYCINAGHANVDQIHVSTLHSLALRALRFAGLLTYPSDPIVMDDWEQENILDAEFSKASGYSTNREGGYSPGRCKEIRSDYEAFCGTGQWLPPNHIPPKLPITDEERIEYERFHNPRTQTYSCVLPGEIVRECVIKMVAGVLNPAALLNIRYLIVDEYQDLNPTDLEFIHRLIGNGVNTFVAGDDDQSIYSFRFASPQGIQTFKERYPQAGDYELRECFRCSTEVLTAAQNLLQHFSEPGRLPKSLLSLYIASEPPVPGFVHRWRFPSFQSEARSIAESCSALIASGVSAKKIMILISNKRAILSTLIQELERININYEAPKSDSYFDSSPGRLINAILRIICNSEDYLAHRLLLGLRPSIGSATCNNIADSVISHNLNYREIFYHPLIQGIFSGRELNALNHARDLCSQIENWSPNETLVERIVEMSSIVANIFGDQAAIQLHESIDFLPDEITLEEMSDYLRADTDEQRAALIEVVYERLDIPLPDDGLLLPKVRIMSMHGAKGLSAQVVFIPGLMEELLPGELRRPYPGLVLEAARMLYVSITRAQAACILTYSTSRIVYANYSRQTPSRFTAYLGGGFVERTNGLTINEIENINQTIQNLS